MEYLTCPYCSSQLSVGYIQSNSSGLKWTLIDEKRGIYVNKTNPNEIMLDKQHLFRPSVIKVFRCATCRIMIIDEDDTSTNI